MSDYSKYMTGWARSAYDNADDFKNCLADLLIEYADTAHGSNSLADMAAALVRQCDDMLPRSGVPINASDMVLAEIELLIRDLQTIHSLVRRQQRSLQSDPTQMQNCKLRKIQLYESASYDK